MLEKETTLVELSLEDMSNVSGGGYYEGGPTVGVGGFLLISVRNSSELTDFAEAALVLL